MQTEKKAENRIKIQPGVRVGQLTVESRTDERKNSYSIWRCRCDCGGEILLDTRCLQRGAISHCGCQSKVKPRQRDLTGRRFGRLVCIEPTSKRGHGGRVVWHCRCDCGNDCHVVGNQLTAGYTKSCGCLGHPPLKDFIGKEFGRLTVLAYDKKENGVHYWRCRCDCGNETVIAQSNLQSGHARSCGCLKADTLRENRKLIGGTSIAALESKKKPAKNNSSGYTGVYKRSDSGKWMAQIRFKGKTYTLGTYSDLEEAVEARRRAETELFDNFIEWYYSAYPEKRRSNEAAK